MRNVKQNRLFVVSSRGFSYDLLGASLRVLRSPDECVGSFFFSPFIIDPIVVNLKNTSCNPKVCAIAMNCGGSTLKREIRLSFYNVCLKINPVLSQRHKGRFVPCPLASTNLAFVGSDPDVLGWHLVSEWNDMDID